jgi:exonuclease III
MHPISMYSISSNINKKTVYVQHSGSRNFNTHLSPTDMSSKQKFKKEILELNDTIDQMDLIDVYRMFHPSTTQYTFFSAAHGTFSKKIIS